ALTINRIATFRYDKRIVKQIKQGNPNVNILFDDFVTDAISVVDYFKKDKTYKKIYVIGHSQGSLVGLLAAKDRADGFISIAGAGRSIDEVIIEQINRNAPMFIEDTKRVFNVLKEGKTTEEYPPALASIFNIGVQPFIMNWMSYNPQEIIKSLKIPALILNGTKDLQITEEDAKLLKKAQPNAQLSIIENMNHVLFTIEGDSLENYKSYNESIHDVSSELISVLLNFIEPLK
ncbi:MAG: alpha/beta hydrolase, partial [Flavobacteriaceae bacterium]|nr:alpha/beta hydrolase [Flavobacteriaceae bacterium]